MGKDELEHLANLARIKMSEEELTGLQSDFGAILKYVSQIQQTQTNTERESNSGMLVNVIREDENPHESGVYSKELLAEAPEREGEFIKVKKILP